MKNKKPKTHHPVNLSIPINTWDDISIKFIKEKQKKADRKLNMSDFLVELLSMGCDGHS